MLFCPLRSSAYNWIHVSRVVWAGMRTTYRWTAENVVAILWSDLVPSVKVAATVSGRGILPCLMHLARRAGRVSVPWGVSQNRTLSSSPLRQKKNLFAVGWRSWVPAHDDVHLISGNGPTEQNDGHGHQDQKTRVRVLNLVFHHPTFLTALRVSWCC